MASNLPVAAKIDGVPSIAELLTTAETPDVGPSKGGSLTDLTGELGNQLAPATDLLARIRNILENINGNIKFMNQKLIEALDMGKDQIEQQEGEAAVAGVEGARAPEGGDDDDGKDVTVNVVEKARGIFDTLFTGIKLLLAGKVLMDFLKIAFPTLAEGIDEFFKNLVAGIRSFAAPAFIKGFLWLPTQIFTIIGKLITPVLKSAGLMSKGMTIGKDVSKIGQIFSKIGKFFGVIKKLIPFMKTIPGLNLIFAIIDIFKGFQMGEEKYGGVMGGLIGSVEQLLKGFIGMPLDLLKKGLSFIFKKLGFENVSEALDSFSFEDMIGNMVEGIVDFVKGMFTKIKELINKAAKWIPGFDGVEMTQDEKQAQVQREVMTPEAQEDIREQAIDELGGKFENWDFTNKKRDELTPEQNEAVAQKMAEITQQKAQVILDQPTKEIEEENIQDKVSKAEAIEKIDATGTGAELREKGQEPNFQLVNQTNASGPQNIDNSTVVNNNTSNKSVTHSAPDIRTHNDDSSLFGASASTYAI